MFNEEEYNPFQDRDPVDEKETQRKASPEERLALAVLEEAIREIRLHGRNRNYSVSKRRYGELTAWFLSDDESWPFSFASICTLFEFSKEAMRTQIITMIGGTQ